MNRIIVLESGQKVEYGSHAELMQQKGVYARLYNMQADSYEPQSSQLHKKDA
ncbi:hypothetical protein [Paenibacillus sp. ACRRX]|uniref:hypothetical protein n=1 Tax=Paenibacillus sp. ACRRX TaxID=2918206 RepID=UPI001EF723CC|nr:hypothetical protein [Paenibacillus sp. ACRRX]